MKHTKKKKSSSQIRRETRRRLERKDNKDSEGSEKVSDKFAMPNGVSNDSEDLNIFACSKCDSKLKSEKGLNIHIGKAHKSEESLSPENERCFSEQNTSLSMSLSKELETRQEEKPEPDQLVCTLCGDLWGPLKTACSPDSIYVRQVQWKSPCSKCWTKNTKVQ